MTPNPNVLFRSNRPAFVSSSHWAGKMVERLEERRLYSHTPATFYNQTNLVSDGQVTAQVTDANLKNAWGIAFNPAADVVWIADNGSGVSTVYHTDGSPVNTGGLYNSVTVPPPAGAAGPSAPTGEVFNPTSGFVVTKGGKSGAAAYVWSTEDGTISAWNPSVDANNAVLEVDQSTSNTVYKGLAMDHVKGQEFIYATDFHNAKVDMFDSQFRAVSGNGRFLDPNIPAGFAPFGIQNIDGDLYVTYAKQNAQQHDDVAGPGNGFVDIYSARGVLLQRFASGGTLNSPWAVVQAPASFGILAGDILVGNFGDGKISAFSPRHDHFVAFVNGSNGQPATIDGLWGLTFGPTTADAGTLFFTAGPNNEADGLFGTLTPGHHH